MAEEKKTRYKTITTKDGTQYKIDTLSRPGDHTTDYTYGRPGLRFDRERDDNGRPIKETTTWPNGQKTTTTYEYGKDGYTKTKINPDGDKEVSEYTNENKIRKKTSYTVAGEERSITEYKNGRIAKETIKGLGTIEYDENGHIAKADMPGLSKLTTPSQETPTLSADPATYPSPTIKFKPFNPFKKFDPLEKPQNPTPRTWGGPQPGMTPPPPAPWRSFQPKTWGPEPFYPTPRIWGPEPFYPTPGIGGPQPGMTQPYTPGTPTQEPSAGTNGVDDSLLQTLKMFIQLISAFMKITQIFAQFGTSIPKVQQETLVKAPTTPDAQKLQTGTQKINQPLPQNALLNQQLTA